MKNSATDHNNYYTTDKKTRKKKGTKDRLHEYKYDPKHRMLTKSTAITPASTDRPICTKIFSE
jgi:hypothetical protein